MKRFFKLLIIIVAISGNCVVSHARDSEGRLGFIENPSSTRPYFTVPGGAVTVDVKKKIHDNCSCAFFLYLIVDGQRVQLQETRRSDSGKPDYPVQGKTDGDMEVYRYTTVVPNSVKPGLYTLEAKKGSNQDFSNRAVIVLDKFPESYKILHITDVHVGREKDPAAVNEATMLFEAMPEIANALQPDVAIITGDATSGAKPEEFKRFLEDLDKFTAPTIVTPGNHDYKNGTAESYFGAGNYTVPYGKHVFISMDTSAVDTLAFPDETGRMKWLKERLAEFSDSPVKIVFTHEYDGPLGDFLKELSPEAPSVLLLGHTHSNRTEQNKKPPSVLLETPAYADGFYRIVTVKDSKYAGEKLVIMERSGEYYIKGGEGAPAPVGNATEAPVEK